MSNKDSRTNKPVVPMYMDLTYVPHHGNSHYTSVEFFKRVRARYYVFSGTEPSRDVFNALLEAKQTWEDKDLGKYLEKIVKNRTESLACAMTCIVREVE